MQVFVKYDGPTSRCDIRGRGAALSTSILSGLAAGRSHARNGSIGEPKVGHLICGEGRAMQEVPPDQVDLSPLMSNSAAAHILLLARGQLNRAFRSHSLIPPDPLPVGPTGDIDAADLDDPAACGIKQAMAKFGEFFLTWSTRMPVTLVPPVLAILDRTYQAVKLRPGESGAAVLAAHNFLAGMSPGR